MTSSSPPATRPILGITLKVLATLFFSFMATLVKLVSDRYPLGEIIFFRSFFALIPVFIWAGWQAKHVSAVVTVFHTDRLLGHFARSAVGIVGMAFGFAALNMLPIADATAITYATPLLTVVFAVLLLGEQVYIFRWSAVVVGLVGVVIILSDFFGPEASGTARNSVGAIVALIGAAAAALAATVTRNLARQESAATIVIYFSSWTALFGLLTLPFGWVMPTAADAPLLIGAGLVGGVAQVLLTLSYRYGDAGTIAPFDYMSMLWILAISWLVFGTWPSNRILIGAAIVVVAGLFVIWREHALGIERARSKEAQTPTSGPAA